MSLQKFNEFLADYSGITGEVLLKYSDSNQDDYNLVFFKPYQSTADFFKRMAYVATAPVFLSLIALELTVGAMIVGLSILIDAVSLDLDGAKQTAATAYSLLLGAGAMMLFAIASPIVNLVDLIGGGIASLRQDKKEEEFVAASECSV